MAEREGRVMGFADVVLVSVLSEHILLYKYLPSSPRSGHSRNYPSLSVPRKPMLNRLWPMEQNRLMHPGRASASAICKSKKRTKTH